MFARFYRFTFSERNYAIKAQTTEQIGNNEHVCDVRFPFPLG